MKTHKTLILTVACFFTLANLPGFAKEANLITQGEAYSIEGYPLSLQESILFATKNNFEINIARIEQNINSFNVPIAKSIYDTTLTANFGYTVDNDELTTSLDRNKENETDWGIGLSKKFSWGSILSLDLLGKRNSANTNTPGFNPYYTSDGSASITQPLLKNSFGIIDRNTVSIEKIDV